MLLTHAQGLQAANSYCRVDNQNSASVLGRGGDVAGNQCGFACFRV